jgi:hypothetical protein
MVIFVTGEDVLEEGEDKTYFERRVCVKGRNLYVRDVWSVPSSLSEY